MRPNLFIIGAPKCGTTAVANWLSLHPNVYMSPEKEPNFFCDPYGRPIAEEEYEALFSAAQPFHHRVVEASVWSLWSPSAMKAINLYAPGALAIACIRNPVEMAFSLHQQKVLSRHERERDFAKAWSLGPARAEGRMESIRGIPQGDARHMDYYGACKLGSQLAVAREMFGNRLFVVVLDDLKSCPGEVWSELVRFLGLPDMEAPDLQVLNPAKHNKSALLGDVLFWARKIKKSVGIKRPSGLLRFLQAANLNVRKSEMPTAVRCNLEVAFLPEIRLLEKQLDRDFSHWIVQRRALQ